MQNTLLELLAFAWDVNSTSKILPSKAKAEIRLLKQQLADQAQLLKAKIDKDISVDDDGTIASDRNDNTSGETAGKGTINCLNFFCN